MMSLLVEPQRKRQAIMMMGDGIIILLVVVLGYAFRVVVYEKTSFLIVFERMSWNVWVAVAIHLMVFYIFNLYRRVGNKLDSGQVVNIIVAIFASSVILASVFYLFPFHRFGRLILMFHMPVLAIGMILWRIYYTRLINLMSLNRVLFLGSVNEQQTFLGDLISRDGIGYELVRDGNLSLKISLPDKDNLHYLRELIKKQKVNTLILPSYDAMPDSLVNELLQIKFQGVNIFDMPAFYQMLTRKMPVCLIDSAWLLSSTGPLHICAPIYRNIKSLMDVPFALLGLILCSPLILIISAIIKVTGRGPVFFRQERIGRNQVPFILYKFRTMIDESERETGPVWARKDDPRFTKVGKFLRKTRLDEIPQMYNILKRDMSFIGPRPIRKYFADLLAEKNPFYHLRFFVLPGITGWAQVHQDYVRSEGGQLDKLEYDLYYILNYSIALDLLILLKTLQAILFKRGD